MSHPRTDLVISARDDRYGTYASAQYTASQIPGATFIGFDEGGHTRVKREPWLPMIS